MALTVESRCRLPIGSLQSDLWSKPLEEAAHGVGGHDAGRRRLLLIAQEMLGQLLGPKPSPGSGIECFNPQLFGPIMPLVEIFGDPLESGAVTQRLPSTGLVGRRPEELPVDEAFHHDNGMPVLLEPIGGQTRQAQAHGSRG